MELYKIDTEITIDGCEGTIITSEKELQDNNLEEWMTDTFIEFNHITPIHTDINIEAYIYNSISNTWMNMASYYGSEKRFVKLT